MVVYGRDKMTPKDRPAGLLVFQYHKMNIYSYFYIVFLSFFKRIF